MIECGVTETPHNSTITHKTNKGTHGITNSFQVKSATMHSCLKKYDPNFLVDDLLDYDTCFSIPQGYFVFDGPSTVSPSRGQRDPLSETQDKYPVLISLDIFRLLAEPSQVWNNCIVTSCLNAACAINKDPKIFVDAVIYNNPYHLERNRDMHARTSNVPPEC